MASPQGAGRFCWTLSRASSQYFFNRTADSLLRTSDQRHFGLLTNCGLGHLLRTAKLSAANCGLRTNSAYQGVRSAQLVSQFVVSQQSEIPLVRSPQCTWSAVRSSYCTALIMSKIGRYIATTMPPTMTPRNTIMIGS